MATLTLWFIVAVTNPMILLWIAVLLTVVTVVVTFLFRNPQRTTPELSDLDIVSPADGKIVSIGPANEPQFMKKKALKVSIFLSLLDVHVNWIPVSGVVMHRQSADGTFLPAYTEKASDKNKRVSVGIQCDDGFCMTVVQITGFVARRIKCHLSLGQEVHRGDRYGMICFGSRVDLFLPNETILTVRKGDRVKGGITVIGHKHSRHGENKISAS
ncbi:hypothetical protein AMJ86_00930 [bacterium SM23_57]|nr:MAG: hypothetical protein AMJ86_00930 [bacterium SM23_57]